MFSTNPNLEIEKYEEYYTVYGVCRCCLAKGQHRDVTKEYYYRNIKEVYKDMILECFNFSLSSHIGITSLICDDCVLRLRDASTFRMMVAATEAQLLNPIVMGDPATVTGIVSGICQFTTELKKEIESDNPNDEIDEVLEDIQSILENDNNSQMADINNDDDESPEDEHIDDDVEYVDDNVPGTCQFTTDVKKETGSANQNDEINEVLEDIQSILENDNNLQMANINDDVDNNVPGTCQFTTEVKKETGSANQNDEINEVLEDIQSILDSMPATSHNDSNSQMANIDDEDDESPEDELVIDDDVGYIDDYDIYCSSVTRSAASTKDHEPCEIVEETVLFVPTDSYETILL